MNANWNEFRQQMPAAARWAYFDHAAVAPLSLPAAQALADWANEMAVNGDANWSEWHRRIEHVRQTAATLLTCLADEVAFVPNTTSGLTLIAESFPWQPGDNVVVPASEFPSNMLPWRNLVDRGVEVRVVPCEIEGCDTDQLLAAANERTRIVTVSWVGYVTGWRQDLDELADRCHRRGILLCVDGIQGLGVIPLDVSRTPIDFLAADGHKWLLGPEGAGVLFIRREHLDRLRPMGLGWNSVRGAGNFNRRESDFDALPPDGEQRFLIAPPLPIQELKASAARLEGGSANVGGILALGASLELLLSWGVEEIWTQLQEVTERLKLLLEECGANVISAKDDRRRSGIVACEFPARSTDRLRERALQQRVVLNLRRGYVRLSPHVYTNDDDLERLRRVLTGV